MSRSEVGQNSEAVSSFLSYISHDFARPAPPAHRGPGRPYKPSTTMAPLEGARPWRTKKLGIQLISPNAGRLVEFWKVLAEAGSSTILRWERFLTDCKKSTPLQVFRKFSILLIVLEEILGSVHQLVSQILSLALVCHQ